MRILLTGASGYVGSQILKIAKVQAHSILTVGRSVLPNCENFQWDATSGDIPKLEGVFDRVIHVAGKAHSVPRTESEAQLFFKVNYEGLKQLTSAIGKLPELPNQFILISTVAVYGKDSGVEITESQEPIPTTPYGKSKLLAEKHLTKWCELNSIIPTVLRLPLVVGSNPPGNLGEMINSIQRSRYVGITNNRASKSMVVCKDVAKLVLQSSLASGTYNLTDGHHPNFMQVEQAIMQATGGKSLMHIPKSLLKIPAAFGTILQQIGIGFPLDLDRLDKVTSTLTFNDDLAKSNLGWQPSNALDILSKPSLISANV